MTDAQTPVRSKVIGNVLEFHPSVNLNAEMGHDLQLKFVMTETNLTLMDALKTAQLILDGFAFDKNVFLIVGI